MTCLTLCSFDIKSHQEIIFIEKMILFFYIIFVVCFFMRQKTHLVAGIFLTVMAVILIPPTAFAQYDVVNQGSLYDWIEDPSNKKTIATESDAFGSGTPYFAADGILGASVLSAGVFGGIATMFFIRGRKGKYAAMGRG